jgi:transcription initiation factor TFIID subunit 3
MTEANYDMILWAVRMAETFSRNALKMVVAQICQTIGWHAIQSTPLDIMIDLLQRYITEVGKLTHRYTEQCK